MKFIIGLVAAMALLFGIGWVVESNNLAMTGFFAPRYEQVRRDTFEQSESFIEGQRRTLADMRLDFKSSTGDRKEAIRSMALHMISGLPESAMTYDIRSFKSELAN